MAFRLSCKRLIQQKWDLMFSKAELVKNLILYILKRVLCTLLLLLKERRGGLVIIRLGILINDIIFVLLFGSACRTNLANFMMWCGYGFIYDLNDILVFQED